MSSEQQYPKGMLATAKGVGRILSIGNGWFSESGEYQFTSHLKDIRPLVVLDLDPFLITPKMLIETLNVAQTRTGSSTIDLGRRSGHVYRLQWLINEIEEQSQPPKPAEPKGAGAVVEDRAGDWWVLLSRGSEGAHWHLVGVPDKRAGWSAIHVVKVLSEGVPTS